MSLRRSVRFGSIIRSGVMYVDLYFSFGFGFDFGFTRLGFCSCSCSLFCALCYASNLLEYMRVCVYTHALVCFICIYA